MKLAKITPKQRDGIKDLDLGGFLGGGVLLMDGNYAINQKVCDAAVALGKLPEDTELEEIGKMEFHYNNNIPSKLVVN